MENKFKEGQVVYAKTNPALKLVIRRYVDRIYYCKVQENPNQKEHVYFERELMEAEPDRKENSIETKKKLTNAILEISMKITETFPELSKYIEEMRVKISYSNDTEITNQNFKDYYDSLVDLFNKYSKDHKSLTHSPSNFTRCD